MKSHTGNKTSGVQTQHIADEPADLSELSEIPNAESMHLMKKSFVGGDEVEESFKNAQGKDKPVKLSWHDLHYSVTLPKDKKTNEVKDLKIIKGVTGYALPGQTLYIMGASGAGKTTLLNLISDRAKSDGKHSKKGKVLVNNSSEVT